MSIALTGNVASGRCVFDIVKAPNVEVDTADLGEFHTAASRLANVCLGNGRRRGGIAVNIGEFALV